MGKRLCILFKDSQMISSFLNLLRTKKCCRAVGSIAVMRVLVLSFCKGHFLDPGGHERTAKP